MTDSHRTYGILLINTGTPDAPTPPALRRYLAQFLGDPRVIEYPRWLWLPLLHGVILQVRPRRSAALYRRIWTEEGSPLLLNTRRLASGLQTALSERMESPLCTAVGMCYGNPSVAAGLQALRDQGADHLIVLPLFPQYSATTTGASVDAVFKVLQNWRWVPDLQIISGYHEHPAYIRAVSRNLAAQWDGAGKLLMSFHGIPVSYVNRGDPYQAQCLETAALIAGRLALQPESWSVSFQSRFGPEAWLQPYTDAELERLGAAGMDRLSVVCPGFAVDCLETLDEINREGRIQFQRAGGGAFAYIPALNRSPDHVEALADIILSKIQHPDHGAGQRPVLRRQTDLDGKPEPLRVFPHKRDEQDE